MIAEDDSTEVTEVELPEANTAEANAATLETVEDMDAVDLASPDEENISISISNPAVYLAATPAELSVEAGTGANLANDTTMDAHSPLSHGNSHDCLVRAKSAPDLATGYNSSLAPDTPASPASSFTFYPSPKKFPECYQETEFLIYSQHLGMHLSESRGVFTVIQSPSSETSSSSGFNSSGSSAAADVALEFKLFLDHNAKTHSEITKDLMQKWKAAQREKSLATRRRAVDFSASVFIVAQEGVSPAAAPTSPVIATPASPSSTKTPSAVIPQAHPVDAVPNYNIRDSVADMRASLISPERVIGPTEAVLCPYDVPSSISPRLRDAVESHLHLPAPHGRRSSAEGAKQGSTSNTVKVLYEGDEIFGYGIKKTIRIELKGGVDCDSVESNIALLRSDLLSKAKEALGHEKMRLMAEKGVEADVLLSYFDADLDAHVVLEADSWGDFMQQAKKMLRVALIEVEAPSPVASNAQNHIDIDIEDSLLHNLPSDQLSTVASPMSPDDGINDSSRSSEAKVGEWMPTNGTGPEIGSELIMVNGIKVVGLRRRLVFELLSQRSRPLLLLFRKKVDQTSPNPKREYLSPSNHVASTYDDEWDSGDEGAVSEGASVTGSAAGAAAIQFSIGRGPTWARKRKAFVNESLSIVPADIDYLSYDMFLSKYFAPQGIRMRKKVDESISAFLAFNWKEYSSPNTQQETIKSLYKYIETELLRLGMFNKKLQQGSDAPDMTDRYKARLRMHIERFVMAKVKSLISDPTSPAFKSLESYPETVNRLKREAAFNDASNDVLEDFGKFHFATLSERIAFLRFLTLEDLGLTLELPLSLDYISKLLRFGNMSGESDGSISSSRQFREDWNIAMSEVVDALSKMSRSPSDVSRRIQSAVALAMSAAERYLATGNVYREQVMTVPVYPKDKRSSTGVAEEYRNMFRKMPAGATLINQHRPALGADELLPMVTWLLIQANPQTAELCLCYCSEFLNPELARGQAYYNLAQVMSALEFIKSAGPDELLCSMHPSGAEGDQEEEIKTQRRKVLAKYASFYNSSLNLLKACKRGDVHGVEKWLDRGADINMYSPDQRNTPLTMAVRYSQKDVMKKLLTYIPSKSNKNDDPKTILDVNLPVGIINADLPPHRITALHIAVSIGDTEAVIELLKAGADRYAKDREGHDPLDVAIKAEFSEIAKVLLADPEVHALVPAVLSGHVAIVEGLLKQGAVVDAIDSNYGISALIAAIHAMHECILAILLSQYKICSQIMLSGIIAAGQITLQPFSLDSKDSSGATALMWCGKAKSLVHGLKSAVQAQQDYYYSLEEVDPQNVRDIDDLTRMKLAIRLCAAGANRYVVDHEGRSAFWWAIHGGGAADDLDLTTKQLREKLQVAQEKSKKTSSSLISVLDVCKFPRLAAVLYYDPEKFSIFELARDNCFEGVRALLDQGADPNSVCPVDGYSAILAAAYNSNSSILELLVADRRTDLNFCNYRMGAFTALHYCASRGDAVMCGRLLYAGACRTPQSKTGKTPYDLAMERGHKLAADVCRYDPEKVSICLAAKHGDIGITRILLLQGVSINTSRRHKTLTGKSKNQLYSPLIAACVYGRVDYIQFLFAVSDGAFDPHRNDECIRRETLLVDLANPDGNTALMCAAMVGNEQIVLLLLNRGNANRYLVDAGGRTAADWAQRYEHKVVHEILINDPERCSIHHCAARGDLRSVVALLKQKVETNLRFAGEATSRGTSIHPPPSQAPAATSSLSPSSPSLASIPPPPPPTQLHYFIMGETPLAVAARFNALPILRLLLQAPDILIDARDEEGVTALGRAAQTGHEDCVLELLNHKANRYIGKKKPVDLALASGHVTVAALIEADAERVSCHDLVESGRTMLVQGMLKQGFPVNSLDPREGRNQEPLLVCAARNGKGDIVRMLLANESIAINAADSTGATALMRAAGRGDLQICEYLLAHPSCNPDLKDLAGKKASDYALSHGYVFYTRYIMRR